MEEGAVVTWWQGVLSYLHPALLWCWFTGPHSWVSRIYRNIKSGFDPRFRRRRRLLSWVAQASGRDVTDLATVWQDGTILCDVLHHSLPSACVGHEESQAQDTFRHAQALAYRCLLLQPAFTEIELSRTELTPNIEKRLFRYLQSLRLAISKKKLDRSVEEESDGEAHIAEEYIARGMGLIMASRIQRAIFYVYSRDGSSLMDIHIEIRGPGDDFGSILVTESENYDNPTGASIPVEYRLTEEYLRVSYQPRSVGHHELSISRHGYNVPGSPFLVSVDEISEKVPKKRFNSVEWFTEDEDRRQKELQEKKNKAKVKYRIVDFVSEKMYLTEDGKLLKVPPEDVQCTTPPPPDFPAPIPPFTSEILHLTPSSPTSSTDSRVLSRKSRTLSPRPRVKRGERTKWMNIKQERMKYIIVRPQKAELKRVSDAAAQVTLEFQPSMFQERCKRIVTVCDYLLKHCPRQTSLEIISGAGNILQSLQYDQDRNENSVRKKPKISETEEDDDVFVSTTAPIPTTVKTITYPGKCRSVSLSHVKDDSNDSHNDTEQSNHGSDAERRESGSSITQHLASDARKSFRTEGNTKTPGRRTSFSSIYQVSDSQSQTKSTIDEDSYDLLTVSNDHTVDSEASPDHTIVDEEIKLVNYKQFSKEKCSLDFIQNNTTLDDVLSEHSDASILVECNNTSYIGNDVTSEVVNVINRTGSMNYQLAKHERPSKSINNKVVLSKGNSIGKIIARFETNLSSDLDRGCSATVSPAESSVENEKPKITNTLGPSVFVSPVYKPKVTTGKENENVENDKKLQIEYLKSIGAPLSTIRAKIELFEKGIAKETCKNNSTSPLTEIGINCITRSKIVNEHDCNIANTDSEVERIFRAEPAMVVSKHYAELQEMCVTTDPAIEGIIFDFQPQRSPSKSTSAQALTDKVGCQETNCESEYKLDTWDPGILQESLLGEVSVSSTSTTDRDNHESFLDPLSNATLSEKEFKCGNSSENVNEDKHTLQTDIRINNAEELNVQSLKTEPRSTNAQILTGNATAEENIVSNENLRLLSSTTCPEDPFPSIDYINTEQEQTITIDVANNLRNQYFPSEKDTIEENVNKYTDKTELVVSSHRGEADCSRCLPQKTELGIVSETASDHVIIVDINSPSREKSKDISNSEVEELIVDEVNASFQGTKLIITGKEYYLANDIEKSSDMSELQISSKNSELAIHGEYQTQTKNLDSETPCYISESISLIGQIPSDDNIQDINTTTTTVNQSDNKVHHPPGNIEPMITIKGVITSGEETEKQAPNMKLSEVNTETKTLEVPYKVSDLKVSISKASTEQRFVSETLSESEIQIKKYEAVNETPTTHTHKTSSCENKLAMLSKEGTEHLTIEEAETLPDTTESVISLLELNRKDKIVKDVERPCEKPKIKVMSGESTKEQLIHDNIADETSNTLLLNQNLKTSIKLLSENEVKIYPDSTDLVIPLSNAAEGQEIVEEDKSLNIETKLSVLVSESMRCLESNSEYITLFNNNTEVLSTSMKVDTEHLAGKLQSNETELKVSCIEAIKEPAIPDDITCQTINSSLLMENCRTTSGLFTSFKDDNIISNMEIMFSNSGAAKEQYSKLTEEIIETEKIVHRQGKLNLALTYIEDMTKGGIGEEVVIPIVESDMEIPCIQPLTTQGVFEDLVNLPNDSKLITAVRCPETENTISVEDLNSLDKNNLLIQNYEAEAIHATTENIEVIPDELKLATPLRPELTGLFRKEPVLKKLDESKKGFVCSGVSNDQAIPEEVRIQEKYTGMSITYSDAVVSEEYLSSPTDITISSTNAPIGNTIFQKDDFPPETMQPIILVTEITNTPGNSTKKDNFSELTQNTVASSDHATINFKSTKVECSHDNFEEAITIKEIATDSENSEEHHKIDICENTIRLSNNDKEQNISDSLSAEHEENKNSESKHEITNTQIKKELNIYPISGLTQKLVKVFENIYDKTPAKSIDRGSNYDCGHIAKQNYVDPPSLKALKNPIKVSDAYTQLPTASNETNEVEVKGLTKKLVKLFETIYEPVNSECKSILTGEHSGLLENVESERQNIKYTKASPLLQIPPSNLRGEDITTDIDRPNSPSFSGLTKRLVEVFDNISDHSIKGDTLSAINTDLADREECNDTIIPILTSSNKGVKIDSTSHSHKDGVENISKKVESEQEKSKICTPDIGITPTDNKDQNKTEPCFESDNTLIEKTAGQITHKDLEFFTTETGKAFTEAPCKEKRLDSGVAEHVQHEQDTIKRVTKDSVSCDEHTVTDYLDETRFSSDNIKADSVQYVTEEVLVKDFVSTEKHEHHTIDQYNDGIELILNQHYAEKICIKEENLVAEEVKLEQEKNKTRIKENESGMEKTEFDAPFITGNKDMALEHDCTDVVSMKENSLEQSAYDDSTTNGGPVTDIVEIKQNKTNLITTPIEINIEPPIAERLIAEGDDLKQVKPKSNAKENESNMDKTGFETHSEITLQSNKAFALEQYGTHLIAAEIKDGLEPSGTKDVSVNDKPLVDLGDFYHDKTNSITTENEISLEQSLTEDLLVIKKLVSEELDLEQATTKLIAKENERDMGNPGFEIPCNTELQGNKEMVLESCDKNVMPTNIESSLELGRTEDFSVNDQRVANIVDIAQDKIIKTITESEKSLELTMAEDLTVIEQPGGDVYLEPGNHTIQSSMIEDSIEQNISDDLTFHEHPEAREVHSDQAKANVTTNENDGDMKETGSETLFVTELQGNEVVTLERDGTNAMPTDIESSLNPSTTNTLTVKEHLVGDISDIEHDEIIKTTSVSDNGSEATITENCIEIEHTVAEKVGLGQAKINSITKENEICIKIGIDSPFVTELQDSEEVVLEQDGKTLLPAGIDISVEQSITKDLTLNDYPAADIVDIKHVETKTMTSEGGNSLEEDLLVLKRPGDKEVYLEQDKHTINSSKIEDSIEQQTTEIFSFNEKADTGEVDLEQTKENSIKTGNENTTFKTASVVKLQHNATALEAKTLVERNECGMEETRFETPSDVKLQINEVLALDKNCTEIMPTEIENSFNLSRTEDININHHSGVDLVNITEDKIKPVNTEIENSLEPTVIEGLPDIEQSVDEKFDLEKAKCKFITKEDESYIEKMGFETPSVMELQGGEEVALEEDGKNMLPTESKISLEKCGTEGLADNDHPIADRVHTERHETRTVATENEKSLEHNKREDPLTIEQPVAEEVYIEKDTQQIKISKTESTIKQPITEDLTSNEQLSEFYLEKDIENSITKGNESDMVKKGYETSSVIKQQDFVEVAQEPGGINKIPTEKESSVGQPVNEDSTIIDHIVEDIVDIEQNKTDLMTTTIKISLEKTITEDLTVIEQLDAESFYLDLEKDKSVANEEKSSMDKMEFEDISVSELQYNEGIAIECNGTQPIPKEIESKLAPSRTEDLTVNDHSVVDIVIIEHDETNIMNTERENSLEQTKTKDLPVTKRPVSEEVDLEQIKTKSITKENEIVIEKAEFETSSLIGQQSDKTLSEKQAGTNVLPTEIERSLKESITEELTVHGYPFVNRVDIENKENETMTKKSENSLEQAKTEDLALIKHPLSEDTEQKQAKKRSLRKEKETRMAKMGFETPSVIKLQGNEEVALEQDGEDLMPTEINSNIGQSRTNDLTDMYCPVTDKVHVGHDETDTMTTENRYSVEQTITLGPLDFEQPVFEEVDIEKIEEWSITKENKNVLEKPEFETSFVMELQENEKVALEHDCTNVMPTEIKTHTKQFRIEDLAFNGDPVKDIVNNEHSKTEPITVECEKILEETITEDLPITVKPFAEEVDLEQANHKLITKENENKLEKTGFETHSVMELQGNEEVALKHDGENQIPTDIKSNIRQSRTDDLSGMYCPAMVIVHIEQNETDAMATESKYSVEQIITLDLPVIEQPVVEEVNMEKIKDSSITKENESVLEKLEFETPSVMEHQVNKEVALEKEGINIISKEAESHLQQFRTEDLTYNENLVECETKTTEGLDLQQTNLKSITKENESELEKVGFGTSSVFERQDNQEMVHRQDGTYLMPEEIANRLEQYKAEDFAGNDCPIADIFDIEQSERKVINTESKNEIEHTIPTNHPFTQQPVSREGDLERIELQGGGELAKEHDGTNILSTEIERSLEKYGSEYHTHNDHPVYIVDIKESETNAMSTESQKLLEQTITGDFSIIEQPVAKEVYMEQIKSISLTQEKESYVEKKEFETPFVIEPQGNKEVGEQDGTNLVPTEKESSSRRCLHEDPIVPLPDKVYVQNNYTKTLAIDNEISLEQIISKDIPVFNNPVAEEFYLEQVEPKHKILECEGNIEQPVTEPLNDQIAADEVYLEQTYSKSITTENEIGLEKQAYETFHINVPKDNKAMDLEQEGNKPGQPGFGELDLKQHVTKPTTTENVNFVVSNLTESINVIDQSVAQEVYTKRDDPKAITLDESNSKKTDSDYIDFHERSVPDGVNRERNETKQMAKENERCTVKTVFEALAVDGKTFAKEVEDDEPNAMTVGNKKLSVIENLDGNEVHDPGIVELEQENTVFIKKEDANSIDKILVDIITVIEQSVDDVINKEQDETNLVSTEKKYGIEKTVTENSPAYEQHIAEPICLGINRTKVKPKPLMELIGMEGLEQNANTSESAIIDDQIVSEDLPGNEKFVTDELGLELDKTKLMTNANNIGMRELLFKNHPTNEKHIAKEDYPEQNEQSLLNIKLESIIAQPVTGDLYMIEHPIADLVYQEQDKTSLITTGNEICAEQSVTDDASANEQPVAELIYLGQNETKQIIAENKESLGKYTIEDISVKEQPFSELLHLKQEVTKEFTTQSEISSEQPITNICAVYDQPSTEQVHMEQHETKVKTVENITSLEQIVFEDTSFNQQLAAEEAIDKVVDFAQDRTKVINTINESSLDRTVAKGHMINEEPVFEHTDLKQDKSKVIIKENLNAQPVAKESNINDQSVTNHVDVRQDEVEEKRKSKEQALTEELLVNKECVAEKTEVEQDKTIFITKQNDSKPERSIEAHKANERGHLEQDCPNLIPQNNENRIDKPVSEDLSDNENIVTKLVDLEKDETKLLTTESKISLEKSVTKELDFNEQSVAELDQDETNAINTENDIVLNKTVTEDPTEKEQPSSIKDDLQQGNTKLLTVENERGLNRQGIEAPNIIEKSRLKEISLDQDKTTVVHSENKISLEQTVTQDLILNKQPIIELLDREQGETVTIGNENNMEDSGVKGLTVNRQLFIEEVDIEHDRTKGIMQNKSGLEQVVTEDLTGNEQHVTELDYLELNETNMRTTAIENPTLNKQLVGIECSLNQDKAKVLTTDNNFKLDKTVTDNLSTKHEVMEVSEINSHNTEDVSYKTMIGQVTHNNNVRLENQTELLIGIDEATDVPQTLDGIAGISNENEPESQHLATITANYISEHEESNHDVSLSDGKSVDNAVVDCRNHMSSEIERSASKVETTNLDIMTENKNLLLDSPNFSDLTEELGSNQKGIECFDNKPDINSSPIKVHNLVTEQQISEETENQAEQIDLLAFANEKLPKVSAIKGNFNSLEIPDPICISSETANDQSGIRVSNTYLSEEEEDVIMSKLNDEATTNEGSGSDIGVINENEQTFPAKDLYLQLISNINYQSDNLSSLVKISNQCTNNSSLPADMIQISCKRHVPEHLHEYDDGNETKHKELTSESSNIINKTTKCNDSPGLFKEIQSESFSDSFEKTKSIASKIKQFIFTESDEYNVNFTNILPQKEDFDENLTLMAFKNVEDNRTAESTSTTPEPPILSSAILNKFQSSRGKESSIIQQLKERFENSFSNVETCDKLGNMQSFETNDLANNTNDKVNVSSDYNDLIKHNTAFEENLLSLTTINTETTDEETEINVTLPVQVCSEETLLKERVVESQGLNIIWGCGHDSSISNLETSNATATYSFLRNKYPSTLHFKSEEESPSVNISKTNKTHNEGVKQMLSLDSEMLNKNLLTVEQELSEVLSIEDEELDRSLEKEICDIEAMETPDIKDKALFTFQESNEGKINDRVDFDLSIENEKLDLNVQQQIIEIDEMSSTEGVDPSNEFCQDIDSCNKKKIIHVDPSLLSFDPMDISSLEDEKLDGEILTEISKVESVACNKNETNAQTILLPSEYIHKTFVLPKSDLGTDENPIEDEELDEETQKVLHEVEVSSECLVKDDKIETSHSAIGYFSSYGTLDSALSSCPPEIKDKSKIHAIEKRKLIQILHEDLSGFDDNDEAIIEDRKEEYEYEAGECMVDAYDSLKDKALLQPDMNNYDFFNTSKSQGELNFNIDSDKVDLYDDINTCSADPLLSSLHSEITGAGESYSENLQDLKDLNLSMSTESDSSEFHMWSSNVEFGEPGDVSTVQEGMDFDSIISAPNLDEALKKLERHIQDKGESFQWLSTRTPSPSLQSLEKYFKDGVSCFDTEEFYSQVSGGIITDSALSSQEYSSNENEEDPDRIDIWATPCENPPACTYVPGSIEAEGIDVDSQDEPPEDWIISPYQYPRVIFSNTTQMSIIDEEDDSRKSEPTSPLQNKCMNSNINGSQLSPAIIYLPEEIAVQGVLENTGIHTKVNYNSKELYNLNDKSNKEFKLINEDNICDSGKNQNFKESAPENETWMKSALSDNIFIKSDETNDDTFHIMENHNKNISSVECKKEFNPISMEENKIDTIISQNTVQDEIDDPTDSLKENNSMLRNTNQIIQEVEKSDNSKSTCTEYNNMNKDHVESTLADNISYISQISTENVAFTPAVSTQSKINKDGALSNVGVDFQKDIKNREYFENNIDSVTEEMINDFSVSERKLYWDMKLQKLKDLESQSTSYPGPKSLSNIKSGTVSKLVSCFGQTKEDRPGSPILQKQTIYPKTLSYHTNTKPVTTKKYKEENQNVLDKSKDESPDQTQCVDTDTTVQATASMKLVSHWKTYWDDMINEQTETSQIQQRAMHKIPSIQISEDDESGGTTILYDEVFSDLSCNQENNREEQLFSAPTDNTEKIEYLARKTNKDWASTLNQSDASAGNHIDKEYVRQEAADDKPSPSEILSIPVTSRPRSYSTGNIDKEFLTIPNVKCQEVENTCTDGKSHEDSTEHQNEFKMRFERAKQFFKHLEQSAPGDIKGRDYRSMPRLDFRNKSRKPSVDSDSGPEVKPQKKRDQSKGRRKKRKKDKDSCKIQSAPTSDTETSKRVQRQESYDSFGGSVKIRKVSERFHVKDLFRDISDSYGLFKGIPNRTAVLASLRSVNDVRALSPYEMDCGDLKLSASLGNIPSGFQEEYPYLPTTPIHGFRPRSSLGLNLIPRSELLDEKF